MNRLIGFSSTLIPFLLFACAFPLDSKKYINPVQPPPETLLVTAYIQAPDFQDPYPLDWPTVFFFYIDDDGKPINESKVIIDGVVVSSITSGANPMQFTIDPASLSDGSHTVEVDMLIDAHTGSLVNQLGGERYEILFPAFEVLVDRTLPDLEPPQATFVNGYLNLRWGTPVKKNLNFQIFNSRLESNASRLVRTNNFSAQLPSHLIDSGYVGGNSLYQVYVSNFAGQRLVGSVNINRSPAAFTYTVNPDRSSNLSWTNPIAYDAAYKLIDNSGTRTLSLPAGSIGCDSFYLGDQKSYHLHVERTGFASQAYDSVFTITGKAATPGFSQVRILPQQSRAVIMTTWNIYRISLPDFAREDSLSGHQYVPAPLTQLTISTNGNRAAYLMPPYYPVLFNPMDFSQYRYYSIAINDPVQGIIGAVPNHLSSFSNNGFLGTGISFNGSPTAGVFDVTSDPDSYPRPQPLWKDSANVALPVVSDNGEFIAVNAADGSSANVFKNNGGSWNLVGKGAAGDLYFRLNSSELISIGPTIKVYDLTASPGGNGFYTATRTFDYASRFAGQEINRVGYDDVSQDLYVETIDPQYYSTIRVFDGVNFSQKASAKALVRPTATEVPIHFYSGNYHFISTGYWEKVK